MIKVFTMCLNLALAAVNGLDCTAVPATPPPPIEELAIRLTVYDTALCMDNTPCLQGNGDGYFASMVPVEAAWYGRMAACPSEIFGRTIEVMEMTLYCGDNFGFINGEPVAAINYHDEVGWYMHVDVFWPIANQGFPSWNAWYITSWQWGQPEQVVVNLD